MSEQSSSSGLDKKAERMKKLRELHAKRVITIDFIFYFN